MDVLSIWLLPALVISVMYNIAQFIDSKHFKPAQKRDRLGRFCK